MPRSISSSHSRTATNSSSQHSSSFSSVKPPSVRSRGSTAGSFSTNNSEPFIHADNLDTTIQWIPSYYFDDFDQHEAALRPARRNALIPTPTSSVFSSKVSLLPQGLMHLIRTYELEASTKTMLLAMVRMVVHISHQLFPASHTLAEDVARDVEGIAQDICEFLDLVLEKLEHRLDAAFSAHGQLGLHRPTHVEVKIFRRMATLYDEFVYIPFLQLHRQEPEHNMYAVLDDFLDAIFIRLHAITTDATSAEKIVREVEQTLDAAMTHINNTPKRHVPSRSMPVTGTPKILPLRQRENTL
ncbi:hypothetical protein E4T42_01551 [Aureobasidium subglaciale]|nr:hypothetical protein E4T42_01551 [Aureobasidium subglaciale]